MTNTTVTLRVNRFAPRPERNRDRGGSPFARKAPLRRFVRGSGTQASSRQAVDAGLCDQGTPGGHRPRLSADHQAHRRSHVGVPLFLWAWHVRFGCGGHQRHAHPAMHRHGEGLGQARRHRHPDG